MPGAVPDSPIEDPEWVRRHTLNLLRVLAGSTYLRPGLPSHEAIRQAMWDQRARKEDANIVRCDRCGKWSWLYPVCRGCRTRHQRRIA